MSGNEKQNSAAEYGEQQDGAHWTDAGCRVRTSYAALAPRLDVPSDLL